MKIKEGAKIQYIKAELLLGIFIVHDIFSKHGVELVITEATGGHHKQGSLHYLGAACDIRSHDIQDKNLKHAILHECKFSLGADFDMIIEDEGDANEHLHLEYDPK